MRKLFILLAAVAFAFAFTTPAAAEVNFSGFVAFETYMQNVDSDAPGYQDTDDLIWDMDSVCTRVTANFKEGPISGLVELRPLSAGHVRHWFASWNFGAGVFGIGQTWTPEFSCIGSVKRGCGAGGPLDPACSARIPFAQLQFGNLKIAAGKVNTETTLPAYTAAAYAIDNDPDSPTYGTVILVPADGYQTDIETSLPKLMASYNLNVANVGLKLFGGYQTYEIKDLGTNQTYDVDSHVYGITASAGFGPATIKAMVWGGQNISEYGAGAPGFEAGWDGTKIVDADYLAYGIDLAYAVSDTLKVAAGYQTGESEYDYAGTWEDPASSYFVNATFTLAKGVTVTPEYSVVDLEDVTEDGCKTEETKTTWIGLYWQINF